MIFLDFLNIIFNLIFFEFFENVNQLKSPDVDRKYPECNRKSSQIEFDFDTMIFKMLNLIFCNWWKWLRSPEVDRKWWKTQPEMEWKLNEIVGILIQRSNKQIILYWIFEIYFWIDWNLELFVCYSRTRSRQSATPVPTAARRHATATAESAGTTNSAKKVNYFKSNAVNIKVSSYQPKLSRWIGFKLMNLPVGGLSWSSEMIREYWIKSWIKLMRLKLIHLTVDGLPGCSDMLKEYWIKSLIKLMRLELIILPVDVLLKSSGMLRDAQRCSEMLRKYLCKL